MSLYYIILSCTEIKIKTDHNYVFFKIKDFFTISTLNNSYNLESTVVGICKFVMSLIMIETMTTQLYKFTICIIYYIVYTMFYVIHHTALIIIVSKVENKTCTWAPEA